MIKDNSWKEDSIKNLIYNAVKDENSFADIDDMVDYLADIFVNIDNPGYTPDVDDKVYFAVKAEYDKLESEGLDAEDIFDEVLNKIF